MSDQDKEHKRFFNGSWTAFKLIDVADQDEMNMARIKRSENAFRDKYYATANLFCPSPDFLSWRLTIKQKPNKRRSARKHQGKTEDKNIEKTAIFKFALYTGTRNDTALLFCNRNIPIRIKPLLCEGLRCAEMNLMNLQGSSPMELLKLHLDAKRKLPQLQGLCIEPNTHLANLKHSSEPTIEESSAVIKKIGRIESLPKIRAVDVIVDNASLGYYHKSKIAKLQNWSFGTVHMDIKSSSVFHLYSDLSEYLYNQDVPDWLSDGIRKRGKTVIKVNYK